MPSAYTLPVHLVIIYGAPAVGKLTVARELARLAGMKVLHSHLTIDVALAVFEFRSEPYVRLLDKLRLSVLEAAATEGIDVILTMAYLLTARCSRI